MMIVKPMLTTRQWRICSAAFMLFALAVSVAASRGTAQTVQVPQTNEQIQLSFAPLVRKAAPAVVNVFTRKVMRRRQVAPLFDDPFFRRFFGDGFGLPNRPDREQVQNSLGSGVIVDPSGLIITNHHVVEGADEIVVVLSDRREMKARIVGTDERTDLAVLRVEAEGLLPYLEFRDSDELQVGDLVLAIGDPFGVGQTVTSGIISALARTRVGISDLNFFIQTDASINPGNSGGALVTMDGRLAGINTAIFSKTGGSHGIGFAVPSNMVRAVLAGLTQEGQVVRAWFGARGQPVTPDIAASLDLERPAGVLIQDVYLGGPADGAGLRTGDVVLSINGQPVDDTGALRFRIATLPIGGTAGISIWRAGKTHDLRVTLVAPPEDPPRLVTELEGGHPLAEETGADSFLRGVTILEIKPRSPASRLRFQPGDLVRAIGEAVIDDVDDVLSVLKKPADSWRITIVREGREVSAEFSR
jgi:Do/DeqQ family serine protease